MEDQAQVGCADSFITLVRQFSDGMLTRVQDNGESSQPLPVTNGDKQDCIKVSILFSMMFSAMLTDDVPYIEPTVTVGGDKLAVANKLTYIGST